MDFMPPVAFLFKVELEVQGKTIAETSFSDVSGMSVSLETEEYREYGETRTSYRIPTGVKYTNVVLKRGVAPAGSGFVEWCRSAMMEDGVTYIETGTLYVSLLDMSGTIVCRWKMTGAYPVKWDIGEFGGKKNDIAMETVEITYSALNRVA